MADRSILFTKDNRALVRADLKTQTRRVIVPQPEHGVEFCGWSDTGWGEMNGRGGCLCKPVKPRYQVGDDLWMQEPYQIYRGHPGDGVYPTGFIGKYLDDGSVLDCEVTNAEWDKWYERKFPSRKTSSRFMYKSLTRTWRKVKRVWVEQVQDISREDAVAEGIIHEVCHHGHKSVCTAGCRPEPEYKFRDLWDSINLKRGYGWDVNPWNFCYEFERVEK